MLPLLPVTILEYLDARGRSPFAKRFEDLNAEAAGKVVVALTRLGQENFSNAKSIGHGVLEYKIDFGPGYRIYFGRDGERIVILLGGGTKKKQERDIKDAISRWLDYKRRR